MTVTWVHKSQQRELSGEGNKKKKASQEAETVGEEKEQLGQGNAFSYITLQSNDSGGRAALPVIVY